VVEICVRSNQAGTSYILIMVEIMNKLLVFSFIPMLLAGCACHNPAGPSVSDASTAVPVAVYTATLTMQTTPIPTVTPGLMKKPNPNFTPWPTGVIRGVGNE
jgi:hypothetical protein